MTVAQLDAGVLAVPGWRAGAAAAEIKPSGGLDVALLVADAPRTVAGVFTTNALAAAPVQLCRERLARSRQAQAVVVNSGNANAMTGAQGRADAEAMLQQTEALAGGPALVLSTGVIGEPLPMEKVRRGIALASEELAATPAADEAFATAIMTTDTHPKTAARRAELEPGLVVSVGGVAKGSGMIHPNMATMLAVLTTDVPLSPEAADRVLREVVDETFHAISVDGDTSTNDTVLLFAGGHEIPALGLGDPRLPRVAAAVQAVALELAKAIVKDAEGSRRVMELTVTGTTDEQAARQIAHTVATSPLVKTALAGGDPNWGRIVAAAGRAGVPLEPSQLTLAADGVVLLQRGCPDPAARQPAGEVFARDWVPVQLTVGDGPGAATVMTTDLTEAYVAFNSAYTT